MEKSLNNVSENIDKNDETNHYNCIYKITCPNGKIYIGQSFDLLKRKKIRMKSFNRWCKLLESDDKTIPCDTPKLFYAMRAYNWKPSDFVYEILEENIQTRELMNEREEFFIKKFNSVKSGYNISKGGYGCFDGETGRNVNYGKGSVNGVCWSDDTTLYKRLKYKNDDEYRKRANANSLRNYYKHKESISAQRKEHYRKNVERFAEKNLQYRLKNHDELCKKKHEYYLKNREKINLKSKLRYNENRDKIQERNKKYRELNHDKLLESKKKYYYYGGGKERKKLRDKELRESCKYMFSEYGISDTRGFSQMFKRMFK